MPVSPSPQIYDDDIIAAIAAKEACMAVRMMAPSYYVVIADIRLSIVAVWRSARLDERESVTVFDADFSAELAGNSLAIAFEVERLLVSLVCSLEYSRWRHWRVR